MDEAVQQALERDRTIDITTTGRNTGQPRRKEIWFHNIEGRIYITGSPGSRDWYANLVANPQFTSHLKQSAQADLDARAASIRDPNRRRDIFSRIHQKIGGHRDTLGSVDICICNRCTGPFHVIPSAGKH